MFLGPNGPDQPHLNLWTTALLYASAPRAVVPGESSISKGPPRIGDLGCQANVAKETTPVLWLRESTETSRCNLAGEWRWKTRSGLCRAARTMHTKISSASSSVSLTSQSLLPRRQATFCEPVRDIATSWSGKTTGQDLRTDLRVKLRCRDKLAGEPWTK